MTATGDVLLEVDGLTVTYGVVKALREVSMRVGAGTCTAVVGPNGAGKSTLLRTIAGLQRVASGVIRFQDRPLGRLRTEQRARAGLVLVPEGRGLIGSLTVDENLQLTSWARRRGVTAADLDRAYDAVPALKAHRGRRAGELSGGQLQMLALGRALLAAPKLLLLDEPSMGLAPKAVDEAAAVIGGLVADGIAVFLVEQNTRLAAQLADEVYVLQTGQVRWHGPAARLDSTDSRQAYFGAAT